MLIHLAVGIQTYSSLNMVHAFIKAKSALHAGPENTFYASARIAYHPNLLTLLTKIAAGFARLSERIRSQGPK